MEKINFSFINIESDKKLIEMLKNHPVILNFLHENNLNLDFIEKNSQFLNSYIEQIKLCDGCKGLKYCRQNINGKLFKLKYDGVLSNVLVPCKYKIKDSLSKKHLKNYLVNDMSEKFKTVNFEDIVLEKESAQYIDSLSIVLDNIDEFKKGLFLVGNPGSGKTFLASCAANKFAKEGYKVAFVNVPVFSQRIKTKLENNEYKNEIDDLIRCDFLVLDDIGAESVTPWFRDEILFNILNSRMEEDRVTWFTSNEDFKSLQNHYEISSKRVEEKIKGERIISRIKSLSKQLNIIGKDRRI